MASTKDRLLGRRLPTVQHPIRVDFTASADDPDAWVVVELRAMAPALHEALIDAHPPTVAERAADPLATWSKRTYVPALIAASCVDPDLDEDFWDVLWLSEQHADGVGASDARMSSGEVHELFRACQDINERSAGVIVGKGSTPTGS